MKRKGLNKEQLLVSNLDLETFSFQRCLPIIMAVILLLIPILDIDRAERNQSKTEGWDIKLRESKEKRETLVTVCIHF